MSDPTASNVIPIRPVLRPHRESVDAARGLVFTFLASRECGERFVLTSACLTTTATGTGAGRVFKRVAAGRTIHELDLGDIDHAVEVAVLSATIGFAQIATELSMRDLGFVVPPRASTSAWSTKTPIAGRPREV